MVEMVICGAADVVIILGLFTTSKISSFQYVSTWVKGTYFNGKPYCVASYFKGPPRGVYGNPLNSDLHKLQLSTTSIDEVI